MHFGFNYDAIGVSKVGVYRKPTWHLECVLCGKNPMYPVKRIASDTPLLCTFLRLFTLRRIKHHTNDIPSLLEYSYKVWLQQYLARLIIKEILIKEVYYLVFLHAFQYLQQMPISILNRFVHHPIEQSFTILQ